MNSITEYEMANEFENALNNSLSTIPKFDNIFREVKCKQGIPDFIGVINDSILQLEESYINLSKISLETASLLLSLLKHRATRTYEYLVKKSGLTSTTVNKTIKELLDCGLITKTEHGSYLLGERWKEPDIELWAFELKLSNWKRALFQTLQYKAFADRVIIVLPKNKERVIYSNIESFKKLNVGVMTFDASNNEVKVIIKPIKCKPVSRNHSIYAIGRLQNEINKYKWDT